MGLGPQKLTGMFSGFFTVFHLLTVSPPPFSKMLPKKVATMCVDTKGALTGP